MIGIIAAEDLEIEAIKSYMDNVESSTLNSFKYYEGQMSGHDVVLLQGHVGKVNSSVGTTLLLNKFDIDYLLNVGSAGGIKQTQHVGDIVISSNVVHHDVDLTPFGRPYGQLPDLPLGFKADEKLVTTLEKILKKDNKPYTIGQIVSGDQFIHKQEQVDFILEHFPEAKCAEMEGASIAHACYLMGVPFVIIRSISDVFGVDENKVQFDVFLKKASQISAQICYDLVSNDKQ